MNGNPRLKIARFETNGVLDATFDSSAGAGTGTSDEVRAIKLQSDGKILMAGKFTTFSSQPRIGLARLYGDPVAALVTPPQLQVQIAATNLVLNWSAPFVLQKAPSPAGPYKDVSSSPPFTVSFTNPAEFFRLAN